MRFLDNKIHILTVLGICILSAFVVEMIFGIISNSLAMTTDGIHTLMDAAVVFVAIIATKISMRPADKKHTHGYGKLEPLGCMLSGVAIITLAIFFIYISADRLQGPPPEILPSIIGVYGGIYVIAIETFRVYILKRAIRGFGGTAFKSDLQHSYTDIGATSLSIASIPLTIYGFYFMDSVASLILGVFLLFISAKLVYGAALELLDVASPKMVDDLSEIVKSTPGVIKVGPVLLRRSGNTLIADATAIVRGDTSVDAAHNVSEDIEHRIKKQVLGSPTPEEHSFGLSEYIKDAKIAIHVEPDWTDIPIDTKILDIAKNTDDVLDATHASTHKYGGKMYADLHVKVQKDISLASTYEISNRIESKIKDNLPGIERATIRLEPHNELQDHAIQDDTDVNKLIRSILNNHREILGTIKIMSLKFGNIYKIDIDCMLDGEKSIEDTYKVVTAIEHDIIKEIKNAIITIHPVPI